jgi:signal transduction histidine kinase/ActR/RegA family two-component response regulator
VGYILSGSELHAGRLEQMMTTSTLDVSTADAGHVRVDGRRGALSWRELSSTAHVYVLTVIVAGACAVVAWFPSNFPDPWLFTLLLITSCLTSLWKLNLPIPLASGSTLSVSYAANLMALLLLGPRYALIIALAGVWTQCTVRIKQPYPWYQTTFSVAGEALTMVATGFVYRLLGGPLPPVEFAGLARPLVGAITTYFIVNTGLVAAAIATTTNRRVWEVWLTEFSWSGASFMVAGAAGAGAAVVIARGEHWTAVLMIAPVYLTYKTYQVFTGRLEDRDRHAAEARRLHQETTAALSLARQAEHELASEKDRLAATVAELTRLESTRQELLARERTARENAEEGNRLKDQFLATVSHELRTPLNAILGWADMLRTQAIDVALRERACRSIYDNARQQARMIDELLDVARIVSGKLRLERTAVDLDQVVRAALDVVQAAAEAKQLSIVIETDSSIGGVYGDGARLQQIAWNLLSNAVKFSEDGGRVLVRLRRVQAAAEITVSDDGIGIPAEFLPWVFEPFRQADASSTRRHGGLGLGLSIVKHLVEAHGGTISAASPGEGRGSTFSVLLPIRAASPEYARTVPASLSNDEVFVTLEGMSVLVLDDDYESREVSAAHLANRRAVVWTAASAAQALEILQREHIDVVLADIAMPGEDGYSFIRRVRALNAKFATIPAAALTALARDEDRQRALTAGFQLHLAKPVDGQSLIAAVASLGRRPVT